ncbi:hypothetical protein [Polyangium sp. 6x1]|uniref:hypothetical protein n=1 Tax=Polyangium sp. 6x1 TaxID=3042689 RepID=UPI0024831E1C|nr:hypothetical protein [Polyangium sp. 6x1]MDI1447471.1 hypothetical protein [Polyangium sp. 6x1]
MISLNSFNTSAAAAPFGSVVSTLSPIDAASGYATRWLIDVSATSPRAAIASRAERASTVRGAQRFATNNLDGIHALLLGPASRGGTAAHVG